MAKGLLKTTIFGLKYTSITTVLTSILQLGYTAVISRFLMPQDFGLLAIAQIIINFAIEFGTMGLRQAVIQKKDLSQEDIRVSFTITIILSLFLTVLIWFSAPLWAQFFDISDDSITKIIRVLSFSFIIRGFSITASAIMIRELMFKEDTINAIVSYIFGYIIIGIGSAIAGLGVWSLVYAQLGQLVSSTIIAFYYAKHDIRLLFKWKYYIPMFAYGSKMTATGLVNYFSFETPKLLIGKFFGEIQLGLFRQAYWLIYVPLVKMVQGLQNVIFPIFSKLQDELEKLKKSFLTILTILSLIVFPMCLGLSAASKEIILIMFGEKYIGAVEMFSIICYGIGFRFISQLFITVCNAKAKLNSKLIIDILYAVLLIAVSVLLREYGVLGFITILSLFEVARNFALIIIVSKVLNCTWIEILWRYGIGLVFGLVTLIMIYLTTKMLNQYSAPIIIVFIFQVITGILVNSILILFFSPKVLREIIKEYVFKMDFFNNKKGKSILILIRSVNPKFN